MYRLHQLRSFWIQCLHDLCCLSVQCDPTTKEKESCAVSPLHKSMCFQPRGSQGNDCSGATPQNLHYMTLAALVTGEELRISRRQLGPCCLHRGGAEDAVLPQSGVGRSGSRCCFLRCPLCFILQHELSKMCRSDRILGCDEYISLRRLEIIYELMQATVPCNAHRISFAYRTDRIRCGQVMRALELERRNYATHRAPANITENVFANPRRLRIPYRLRTCTMCRGGEENIAGSM